jgi:tetratricopeptide (TPR) repeat protein
LTGQPPYPGADRQELRPQAREAEQIAVLARLDGCGADATLIALARHCLQGNKEDRPRDAGVVSEAVTAYLESAQARLKQAEVDRAAAQARADEEQRRRQAEQARAAAEQARADEEQRRRQAEQAKAHTERQRRRLTAALAAAVVLLVAGLGAAGWWYQHDQLEQAQQRRQREIEESKRQVAEVAQRAQEAASKDYVTREVTDALDKGEDVLMELHQALDRLLPEKKHPLAVSVLLSDLRQWDTRVQTAKASYLQAKKLSDSNPAALAKDQIARLEQLGTQLKQAKALFRIAQQLDDIRLEATTSVDGKFNMAVAGPKYQTLFLDKLQLDMGNGPLPALAAQVKGSALRYVLVAALDHWAVVSTDRKVRLRLLEVARQADPDPWRDQVRNEKTWQDPGQLQKLARDVKPQQQTAPILVLLGTQLFARDSRQEATALLRTALVHHPADFWLNSVLGYLEDNPGEKAGCFRAALAIRPNSGTAHTNLGAALDYKQDRDGAIQEFHKAIELDPRNAMAHSNLGNVLYLKKDLDGAIQEFHKAIELAPELAVAHNNLGMALFLKKDLDGAIQAFHKAIELTPRNPMAHTNLGMALYLKKDLDGAIRECQKAIEIDPKLAMAHHSLGLVLHARNDYKGAMACYKNAIALDPTHAQAHCYLGRALSHLGQFADALKELKIGHELGSRKPSWPHPSAQWVKQCEALLALDQKLAAIQQRQAQPANAAEQLCLAGLCQDYKKQYAAAVAFYAAAFTAAPNLAGDLTKPHRYNAARAAALAAAGKGKDTDRLNVSAKARLRQQALAWLQADLQARKKLLQSSPLSAVSVQNQLKHWQTDPELAAVRDPPALAQLPEGERKAWQTLWADVARLLQGKEKEKVKRNQKSGMLQRDEPESAEATPYSNPRPA